MTMCKACNTDLNEHDAADRFSCAAQLHDEVVFAPPGLIETDLCPCGDTHGRPRTYKKCDCGRCIHCIPHDEYVDEGGFCGCSMCQDNAIDDDGDEV